MTGLLSPAHVVVLLVVLLLVFGAKRLPELGQSLGTGLREFKRSIGADPAQERATLAPSPEAIAQPATATDPVTAAAPALVEAQATHPVAGP